VSGKFGVQVFRQVFRQCDFAGTQQFERLSGQRAQAGLLQGA
jgi:hypothetical protein